MQVLVGKNRSIEKVKPISGDLTLSAFADTVRNQWSYKPFLANGARIEAESDIEYVFKLD